MNKFQRYCLMVCFAIGGCVDAGPGLDTDPPGASTTEQALTMNLAAFKPATQSSTPWGADAARAVDGNIDGNWNNSSVTHTDFDAQAWWQVDLGAVTDIGEIVLYNRTDCCADRLADFDILLSSDGSNWQIAAGLTGPAPAQTTLPIHAAGRFVQVRLRGTNYLSLAEVQVFSPQNLAAFKPATQSSTLDGADAGRAIDGNTDGNWYNNSVTHTGFEAQPWWQVDLGAVTNIGKVVLYNRTDCCAERLSDFRIQLSNDGVIWKTAASYTQPPPPPTRIELSIGASGRFVRVILDGTDYLSLAEVQVFAACVPAKETPHDDQALALGGNPFGGFSVNEIRGPRDCGGQRVSRSVIKLDGTGSCSVVDDGDIFWANELCARNPHMVVGNSEIGAACQAFYAGGPDLGDHDCRYIVHAGAGSAFEGLVCQPSHVTRVAAYCL